MACHPNTEILARKLGPATEEERCKFTASGRKNTTSQYSLVNELHVPFCNYCGGTPLSHVAQQPTGVWTETAVAAPLSGM